MNAANLMKCREWLSRYGKNRIQALQDSCAALFGISLGLVSAEGESLTVWSNSSLICEKIKNSNTESCRRERQRLLKYACEKQKTVKCTCYMGITYFACPIVSGGETIAAFLGGGILEKDGDFARDETLRDVPVISRERLDEIINLIGCTVALFNTVETSPPAEPGDDAFPREEDGNLLLLKNKLTLRELGVVKQINCGLSNKEISLKLNISEKTVKTHISNILRKLKLKDRLEIILYCKNCIH